MYVRLRLSGVLRRPVGTMCRCVVPTILLPFLFAHVGQLGPSRDSTTITHYRLSYIELPSWVNLRISVRAYSTRGCLVGRFSAI